MVLGSKSMKSARELGLTARDALIGAGHVRQKVALLSFELDQLVLCYVLVSYDGKYLTCQCPRHPALLLPSQLMHSLQPEHLCCGVKSL